MTGSEVAQLRSFNRTVTERIGVLETEYLGRGRALGESRLLWEIGRDGIEVRGLRRRLGLDSGYVSRLLRSLEAQGLVAVEASAADARVRTARLTARGRRELAELDRRSDRLAASILAPLDERQRERLADAAATVDRLLRASLVTIEPEDPRSADARLCIERFFAELAQRFPRGFDPEAALPTDETDLLLVARLRGRPVGCAMLKRRPGKVPELKRMWVDPETRGLGLGRRLLHAIEQEARAAGARRLRLDTNGALTEAIALYRASGYREVAPFNDEPHADHWFEKRLARGPLKPDSYRG